MTDHIEVVREALGRRPRDEDDPGFALAHAALDSLEAELAQERQDRDYLETKVAWYDLGRHALEADLREARKERARWEHLAEQAWEDADGLRNAQVVFHIAAEADRAALVEAREGERKQRERFDALTRGEPT